MNLFYYQLALITPTNNKGYETPEEILSGEENGNEQKTKYDEVTSPTFSSTRQLQTLSPTLSNSELQEAVNEYCENPSGWVNSSKYPVYG